MKPLSNPFSSKAQRTGGAAVEPIAVLVLVSALVLSLPTAPAAEAHLSHAHYGHYEEARPHVLATHDAELLAPALLHVANALATT